MRSTSVPGSDTTRSPSRTPRRGAASPGAENVRYRISATDYHAPGGLKAAGYHRGGDDGKTDAAAGGSGDRAGGPDCRTVRGQPVRAVRRRGDQGRVARGRRPAPALAQTA